MAFQHAYVVPILVGVWFPLTFVITYVTAVLRKDVTAVFPYISDTGNWPVESCIFALMVDVGAILMGLTVYIRYRQVRDLLEKIQARPKSPKLNKIALWLGLVAAFGVSAVGDFQETNALPVHILAAGMAFGLGSVYICLTTYLSRELYPTIGSRAINIARVGCCIVCFLSLFLTLAFAGMSLLQFRGTDITKWTEKDGGYTYHIVSAVMEWILALTTVFYLMLFTGDFKAISISQPPFGYKE